MRQRIPAALLTLLIAAALSACTDPGRAQGRGGGEQPGIEQTTQAGGAFDAAQGGSPGGELAEPEGPGEWRSVDYGSDSGAEAIPPAVQSAYGKGPDRDPTRRRSEQRQRPTQERGSGYESGGAVSGQQQQTTQTPQEQNPKQKTKQDQSGQQPR